MRRQAEADRIVRRREFLVGKQGGPDVGPTKRGKGSKIIIMTDGKGLPIGADVRSATPHEVGLLEEVIDQGMFIQELSERLIADKAYDAQWLRQRLDQRGIEMIVPHRRTLRHQREDGRQLRRYSRRWKVERTFSPLHTFRRPVT